MKSVFDYTKDNILKGMPSGNLVVKSEINYDIGFWQYKTYDANSDIRNILRSKWCSTVINLFIFDETTQFDTVEKFFDSNLYEKNG